MKFIDPHVEFLILSIEFVLYAFDLFFYFHLDSGEVVIGDQSAKEFLLGRITFLFQYHLLRIETFLVFVYDFFATAVYFLYFGDHSPHECRCKFNQLEKVSDLLFQIPDFHILVRAFYLVAGAIAVIVGFVFLRMMFGGISLSADCTVGQTSQNEIKLLSPTGIAVVFGHDQLDPFPYFFGDKRFVFSYTYQSSPTHLAIIKLILEYLDHLAMCESFASVSSKSFLIQSITDFVD